MWQRNIKTTLLHALSRSPVVLLNGARQTGKTTLVRHLLNQDFPAQYVTLDDITAHEAARRDPKGFLLSLQRPVIIDEVQRVPELFLAIKADVDNHRRNGRYLLTGSANVMLLPRLAEALVGRLEVLTLWPLSFGEQNGIRELFIDQLFKPDFTPNIKPISKEIIIEALIAGGYPHALLSSPNDRSEVYQSYISTLILRDIRELSDIEGFTILPRLLQMLCYRTSGLLNLSSISQELGIPHSTLGRYMTLFQATYMTSSLPAWFTNIGKRAAKTQKLFVNDTGVACSALNANRESLTQNPELLGRLIETWVYTELLKQSGWSGIKTSLLHYRQLKGSEVDLVLEEPSGKIAAVEIKAAQSVSGSDFKGLESLRSVAGDRFFRGVLFYAGDYLTSFGERLWAVPFGALLTN